MLPTPHREPHGGPSLKGRIAVQERHAAVGGDQNRPGIGVLMRRGAHDHPQKGRDVVWSDIKEEKTIGEERDENAVKVPSPTPITCG